MVIFITYVPKMYLKVPFGSYGRDNIESRSNKVIRELNLGTYTEVYLLPAADIIQINPQLMLRKQNMVGVLPGAALAP